MGTISSLSLGTDTLRCIWDSTTYKDMKDKGIRCIKVYG